jgi:hypothetical protein
MGKFEDEFMQGLEEDDPELAGKFKTAYEMAKKDFAAKMEAAAAKIEEDMVVGFGEFKDSMGQEFQPVKDQLNDLTNLDPNEVKENIQKLRDATTALATYLEERERRFMGLGEKLGKIVRRSLTGL